MADLSTTYLGLKLKNPIIVASSGLTDSIDGIVRLEQHGAAAVVLKSLFEEQIQMDVDSQRMNNSFDTYTDVENYIGFYTKRHNLSNYTTLIKEAKQKVNIPIIASVNCVSSEEWPSFAKQIEDAGADALELNMFIMPSDSSVTGREIEQVYLDIIEKVKQQVSIPLALKVHHYFSGFANFAEELSNTGIGGLVLFNRFYQPDVDLDSEKIVSSHIYSYPEENAMVIRWLGILAGKINCDLAATTGIHDGKTVLKNLLVGAKAVEISSVIYKKGAQVIEEMLAEMNKWLDEHSYASVSSIVGKLKQSELIKPMVYERAQFMRYFSDAK